MFWGAARYTVFDDEAFSCRRYALPMSDMLSALWHGVEPDPPLYYILINGWTRVFGVGPVGLRSLSIVIFLFGLLVIRRAGAAWFGRRTGDLALTLCAFHPAHLFFGFAARWYSLMFLTTALLLWATARLRTAPPPRRPTAEPLRPLDQLPQPLASSRLSRILAWSLAAAAVCYTNYFGIVVVALVWLVGLLRARTRGRPAWPWLAAGVIALALYSPWLVPLYRQAALFPAPDASLRSVAAAAARTLMALTAGNLASIAAWWVWLPMGLFCLSLAVLLVRRWRRVWPVAVIVLGCFAVGVATRTMIDKYVMTFSGPACLLVAALLTRRRIRLTPPPIQNPQSEIRNYPSSFILHPSSLLLLLAWLACAFNLVTETHWSSLRWLDPFEEAVASCQAVRATSDGQDLRPWLLVASHPSALYYSARLAVLKGPIWTSNGLSAAWLAQAGGTDRNLWQMARSRCDDPLLLMSLPPVAATPSVAVPILASLKPDSLCTLETAGFTYVPEWEELHHVLGREFTFREQTYLQDPDAAWKDRLDPAVKHPSWRITVRWWKRIENHE